MKVSSSRACRRSSCSGRAETHTLARNPTELQPIYPIAIGAAESFALGARAGKPSRRGSSYPLDRKATASVHSSLPRPRPSPLGPEPTTTKRNAGSRPADRQSSPAIRVFVRPCRKPAATILPVGHYSDRPAGRSICLASRRRANKHSSELNRETQSNYKPERACVASIAAAGTIAQVFLSLGRPGPLGTRADGRIRRIDRRSPTCLTSGERLEERV
jgi:hypothetical protein